MNKDTLIFALTATGIIYLLITYTKKNIYKVKLKLKTKRIRESIISVTIDKKCYLKGLPDNMTWSNYGYTRLPDSYIIDCNNIQRKYTINDKSIFDKYEVGDIIQLKLIEKLDKDNNVIAYRVTNP